MPVEELPQVNASAGKTMRTAPAAAPEASTRPRNALPASALVDNSPRWEAGSGRRFAALDPHAAQPEKLVPPMSGPAFTNQIDIGITDNTLFRLGR